MSVSKRLGIIAIVAILTVVTYCAQTCFDLDAAPVCPTHHTVDCCKHEAPVSSTLQQAIASLTSGVGKFVPPTPLETAADFALLSPAQLVVFPSAVFDSPQFTASARVPSSVLRI